MGYFSNGTEGDIYESEYCARCVHHDHEPGEDEPCPIWMMHVLYNGKDEFQEILDMFIPRDGVHNLECNMLAEPTIEL